MDRCLSPMGLPEIAVTRRQTEIDRKKLLAAIRDLGAEHVFYMLLGCACNGVQGAAASLAFTASPAL